MITRPSLLLLVYLIIDILILNFSIFLVAPLYSNNIIWKFDGIINYILIPNIAWFLSLIIFPKRNLYLRDGIYNRVKRITVRISIFILIAILLIFLLKPVDFKRTFFLQFTLVYYILKLSFYIFLYIYLKSTRIKGFHTNRAIIVGLNERCTYLRQMLDNNPILGYNFIGFVSSKVTNQTEVLGSPKNLKEIIEKHQIQMVFVSLSLIGNPKRSDEFLRICNEMGIRLRFIQENQRWIKSNLNLESIGNLNLINPQEIPLDDLNARFIKRTFDVLFSFTFLLLVFTWLFPILAILIKISSRGPVFFVQKRTGINNKSFNCLKFRSMQVNERANIQQAKYDDDRITCIGKILRSSNIDELPQFINVLLGQMSVVGPRPHMIKHTIEYSKLIDHYKIRHYVKPGVTGWAQVNGFRGETDELWKMEKRVEYDMIYIENWSIWFDLKIIFLTVFDKKTYNNAY